MSDHSQLIERFYAAFAQRDHAAMNACYHAEVEFQDPVFTLQGGRARAMWHMLCSRGTDLRIEYRDLRADGDRGHAHWEAWYSFSQTGREVHNVIDAEFEFSDGLIRRHRDRFDLWRWTRMALGPAGLVLGWTPLVQGKVRKLAAQSLEQFIEDNPEYAS